MRTGSILVSVIFTLFATSLAARAADDASPDAVKIRVAVFPLGGNADATLKEHVQFALRAKLDRSGHFEPIPGPTMADLVGDKTITLATTPADLKSLAQDEKPAIYLWGEVNHAGAGYELKINLLDTRDLKSSPRLITKKVADETEWRSALEQAMETIDDVGKFEHPIEQSVWDDPQARRLWAANPNLAPDPNFAKSSAWTALYMSEEYAPPIGDVPPGIDKVCIVRQPGEPPRNVLAMNLSKDCAENNGLACLSDFIRIEPEVRYRLQFKYKSQGPSLHVFVKGYAMAPGAATGKPEPRECYKRQVPPSGGTDGKWVTVVDDLNPQHPSYPVQFLRINLYAYLSPGVVEFDDVQLRAVGRQTVKIKDEATKPAAKK